MLVVGSDAYAEMDTWRETRALFDLCTVAVVPRAGEAPAAGLGPAGRNLLEMALNDEEESVAERAEAALQRMP